MLRYRTSAESDGYIKLVVNEAFDGETWKPNSFSPDTAVPISEGAVPTVTRDAAIPVPPESATTSPPCGSSQNYLPTPENLTEVRAEGEWYVDNQTVSVFGGDGVELRRGDQWVAVGDEVSPTPAQLEAALPTPGAAAGRPHQGHDHPGLDRREGAPADPGHDQQARGRRRHPGLAAHGTSPTAPT